MQKEIDYSSGFTYRSIKAEAKSKLQFAYERKQGDLSLEQTTFADIHDFICPLYIHDIKNSMVYPLVFFTNKRNFSDKIRVIPNPVAFEFLDELNIDSEKFNLQEIDETYNSIQSLITKEKLMDKVMIFRQMLHFDSDTVNAALVYKALSNTDQSDDSPINTLLKKTCSPDSKQITTKLFSEYKEIAENCKNNKWSKIICSSNDMLAIALYKLLNQLLENGTVLCVVPELFKGKINDLLCQMIPKEYIKEADDYPFDLRNFQYSTYDHYDKYNFTKQRLTSFLNQKFECYNIPNLLSSYEVVKLLNHVKSHEIYQVPVDTYNYSSTQFNKDLDHIKLYAMHDTTVEQSLNDNPFFGCVSNGTKEEYEHLISLQKELVDLPSKLLKVLNDNILKGFHFEEENFDDLKIYLKLMVASIEYSILPNSIKKIKEQTPLAPLINSYNSHNESKDLVSQFFKNEIFNNDLYDTLDDLKSGNEKRYKLAESKLRPLLKSESENQLAPGIKSLLVYSDSLVTLDTLSREYQKIYHEEVSSLDKTLRLQRAFSNAQLIADCPNLINQLNQRNPNYFIYINTDKGKEETVNVLDSLQSVIDLIDDDLREYFELYPNEEESLITMKVSEIEQYFINKSKVNSTYDQFSKYASYNKITTDSSNCLKQFIDSYEPTNAKCDIETSFELSVLNSYISTARENFAPYEVDYFNILQEMNSQFEDLSTIVSECNAQKIDNRVKILHQLYSVNTPETYDYKPITIVTPSELYKIKDHEYSYVFDFYTSDISSIDLINSFRCGNGVVTLNLNRKQDLRLIKSQGYFVSREEIYYQLYNDNVEYSILHQVSKLFEGSFANNNVYIKTFFVRAENDFLSLIDLAETTKLTLDVNLKFVDLEQALSQLGLEFEVKKLANRNF